MIILVQKKRFVIRQPHKDRLEMTTSIKMNQIRIVKLS